MYLGLKQFRVPPETARVMPTVFSDDELSAMRVPTLLLIGDNEVISDPAKALARARRLIPDFHGDLRIPSGHVLQPISNRGRASARFPEEDTN
jgi:hypothetical protein